MKPTPESSTGWSDLAVEQLTWHWEQHARPPLVGLTDAEYFWELAEGVWSVRERPLARTALAAGAGAWGIDFEHPEPRPAPFTTIAWRQGHLIVGVFGTRVAAHFDGPECDYQSWEYPGTAQGALDQLDAVYQAWVAPMGGPRALFGSDGPTLGS